MEMSTVVGINTAIYFLSRVLQHLGKYRIIGAKLLEVISTNHRSTEAATFGYHVTLGMSPSLFLYLLLSKSYFRLGTFPSSHLELILLLLLLRYRDPLRRSSCPPRLLDLSLPRRLWVVIQWCRETSS